MHKKALQICRAFLFVTDLELYFKWIIAIL